MTLVNVIQKIVENVLSTKKFTDVCYGVVTSINPIKINLLDSKIELSENNLILTDGVIRKEISITTHKHYFEKNIFKHNHNSPLRGETNNVNINIGGQGVYIKAGSSVKLDGDKKEYDLTAEEEEISTLVNREPTKSTLKVKVNGFDIPLSKDKDGNKENDTEETNTYWGVINNGLIVGDTVVMLSVKNEQLYIILSKFYDKYYYVEEE